MHDALEIAADWDAGDLGCGPLIVGLRHELGQLRGGDLLRVTSLNAGAPADLPAWCRMTGHELVATNHPVHIIRKRQQ